MIAATLTMSSSFDYSAIDPETAALVRRVAVKIRADHRRTIQTIINTGVDLLGVKSRLGHGRFGAWLLAEFDWTERTAQRFMSAAEAFQGKSDTVSDLSSTTIYMLASPSTPVTVREDIVRRAEAGERLPDQTVKMMVTEARRVTEKSKRRRARKEARQKYQSPSRQQERERERLKNEADIARRDGNAAEAAAIIVKGCDDKLADLLALLNDCFLWRLMDEIKSRARAAELRP